MAVKYLTLSEIKKELLVIMDVICEYLDSNNITYSIMSGTMLGAIRHNGFIPWDDDIDLGLPRKDYDKLISLLKKNECRITSNIFAIGYELNNSDIPFIKIINKNICVKEIVFENGYSSTNLWIDLFPFDGVPDNGREIFLNNVFVKKRCEYNCKRIYHNRWYKSDGVFSYIKHEIKRVFYNFKSMDDFVQKYIDYCKQFDFETSNDIGDLTFGSKIVPRYLFEDLIWYDFENRKVKGFKDYDTYLRLIYGEYMKLPPKDQRVNHGIKAWRTDTFV